LIIYGYECLSQAHGDPATFLPISDHPYKGFFRMSDKLKILCVSDVVTPELYDNLDPSRFGPADLLISCGDLPPEYLIFLNRSFKAPLYYVRGNHDIRYDNKPMSGCKDIHGILIRHGPIRILGLSGSRWYNGGPNQYTEMEMRRSLWRLVPKIWWKGGVDIVVAHAPPRHVHDAEDLCHRGFRSFNRMIQRHRPAYFLHGHIHAHFKNDEQRITTLGRTRIINCYGYFKFELNEDDFHR
jgi:predicted phosphodiesterase